MIGEFPLQGLLYCMYPLAIKNGHEAMRNLRLKRMVFLWENHLWMGVSPWYIAMFDLRRKFLAMMPTGTCGNVTQERTPMKPDWGHVQVEKLHTWVWMVLSGVESIRVYPIPQDYLNQKRPNVSWLMVITWSWFHVSKKNRCQHGPVTIVFCKKIWCSRSSLGSIKWHQSTSHCLPNC